MTHKRGFTLIELLVVVSVIAVLAGLLIPAVSLIRRMANDVKCGNNLRQVGAAVSMFSMSRNDEKFPGHLRYIVESGGDFQGVTKILLCPRDKVGGGGVSGYNRDWDEDTRVTSPLWMEENPSTPANAPHTSYLYEVSETLISESKYAWFYAYADNGNAPPMPTPLPTWMVAKAVQLRTGNGGEPFARTVMPIIRCFWHDNFGNINAVFPNKVLSKKVKNVSWDLNVFESITTWEHDVNPTVFLP